MEEKTGDWEQQVNETWNGYKAINRGDPEKERYAREKLWPLTLEALKHSWERFPDARVRGAILTVGFSPEPIAGTLAVVKPEYACLLHTDKSEKVVDRVISLAEYPRSRVRLFKVSKDDVSSLYKKFREAVGFLVTECNIPKEEIAVDPTGGTKTMPFAGGIVGLSYNLSLLYVSNEKYDPDERRPIAGHEFFVFKRRLSNSYPIRDYLKAVDLVRNFAFHNALKIWETMYDDEIASHRLLFYLARGLSMWDSFRYDKAIEHFRKVLKISDQFQTTNGEEANRIINSWIDHLLQVKQHEGLKAIDYFCHANRLYEQGNANVAIIMFYVSFETFVEWVCQEHGIDRSEFTQEKLEFKTAEELLRKFKRSFKGGKLGLIEGLAVLAHHYPIDQKQIGRSMRFAELRNDVVHRGKAADASEIENSIDFLKEFFGMFKDKLGEEAFCTRLSSKNLKLIADWLEEISWY
ncbi:MAG: hypothetical protein D6732_26595 [Methanobacteriota archaeon]|nr:MAG: hypothetical protein D6732_26595 [Euryarchaeota archaeon]